MKRLFFWKRGADTAAQDAADAAEQQSTGLLTGDPTQDSQTIAILLESIAEVSSHTGSLDVVIDGIVAKSLEVTKAERAILFLGDAMENLEVRMARTNDGRALGADLVYSRTVVGKCLQESAAQRSVVQSDQEALELGQSVYKLKLRAVMCSPLRGKTGRLGVIYVDSTAVRREFSARDLELFGALSAQLGVALENARLHADSLEKVRLEKDVELARRIQQHLLAPVPDKHPGVDLAVRFHAADRASGDAYDIVTTSSGHLVVMIGDVTGHGVGAALLTHAAQAAMRSYLELIDDISDVARRLNERLVAGVEAGNFMSLLLASIDPRTRALHYVNAGHPGLIIVRDGKVEEHEKTGMVMGVVGGQNYVARGPIQLQPGDLILLRTDGVDEAMNGSREMFGSARLFSTLAECGDVGADACLERVEAAVAAHAGSELRADDYTMVGVRVLAR